MTDGWRRRPGGGRGWATRRATVERPPRRRAPRRRARPLPRTAAARAGRPARRARPAASRARRAFLAYCLALPDDGERRLAEVDVDDYFSAPATRQAAAYLRGRLRTPTANLPAGDDEFARLIAELVVRSGALEATPAKLELEALQLDLHRLERHISSARLYRRDRRHARSPRSARRCSTRSATG